MTTYRDLLLTRPAYPPLVCADGAQVSLQAGYGLYSTPRDNHGPYTHVEAGFPSVPPPASWRPYAEFGIAYADDPDLIAGAIYAQLCAHSSRGRVWMSSSPSTEGWCPPRRSLHGPTRTVRAVNGLGSRRYERARV